MTIRARRVMIARLVPIYHLHDTTGEDLGFVNHAAPNVEAGDVLPLPDGRDAMVTERVETGEAPIVALLEVLVAPSVVAFPSREL